MDELNKYREIINESDNEIVKWLNNRFKAVEQIGIYKKQNGINITDTSREQVVLNKVRNLAVSPLTPDMVENIYKEIIKQAKVEQENGK
ncbi:MAG: chorismate mutase [Mycoplasmataceae bacterium]|nr:chorismate mutase [Mycoplasmataceae bacterium]